MASPSASIRFPYRIIADGAKTGRTLLEAYQTPDDGSFQGFSDVPLEEIQASRIVAVAGEGAAALYLQDPVLLYGGRFSFMDQCPRPGCLAVVYNRDGSVQHSYPFRPEEILAANATPEFAYEEAWFDFARHTRLVGVEDFENGDLLVVFHYRNTFPFGGGVARIAPDGRARWFRRDFSHHVPTLIQGERTLVPSVRLREQSIKVRIHEEDDHTIDVVCRTKMLDDTIQIVGGDGQLLREISTFDSLLASPFRAVIQHTTDRCDPLHLNQIDVVGADLVDPSGVVRPGDFIVSLRNISSIGIIDRNDARFKRLLRGTFLQQHSVRYWRDGKALMFDNHGAGWEGGPSRVVAVDLVSGLEQTIFPTEHTGEAFRSLFSDMSGKIDISPNKKRAIVTFPDASQAIEVRLRDGEVLAVFESLHDASAVTALTAERTRKAAHFRMYGVAYVEAVEEGR
jgi:hypothetical protein